MGLNGVAAPQLFGFDFGVDATPYYYVGLALVALLILTSQRLKDSRIGRAWMAIREDEIAAAAMGVDRVRFKLLAFAIGAAFAGATGTFYVAKLQTATPEMFMFPVSVMILVMIVFGGIGSVWGVVVGALILQILQSWFLEDLSQWLHALGRARRCRVAAACRARLFDRADLRPDPGADDALSARGADPGDAADAGAEPRRADCAGRARRRLRRASRRSAAASRAAAASGPLLEITDLTVRFGGLVALRSVDARASRRIRSSPSSDRTARANRPCSTRSPGSSGRSGHGPLRRRGDRRLAAASGARTRHRPHLPEHPPVPEFDGPRKRHDRHACAARTGAVGALLRLPPHAARGGGGARAGARDPVVVRQPAVAARRSSRGEPLLRQPAAHRNRPRARLAARSCCCSTSRPPG